MFSRYHKNIAHKLSILTDYIPPIYSETFIAIAFTIASMFIGPNKFYLIALVIAIFLMYLTNHNFLQTIWIMFLTILTFHRGRIYPITVVLASYWNNSYDLTYNMEILFSDLIITLLIYGLISRKGTTALKINVPASFKYLVGSIICYITIAALSVANSQFFNTSIYFYIQLIKMIMIFFISIIMFSQKTTKQKSLQILYFITCLNAGLVIAQYLHGGPFGFAIEDMSSLYGWRTLEDPNLYRPGGLFSDPNISATMFVCSLPFLITNILNSKKNQLIFHWLVLGAALIALIITNSRTAWAVAFLIFLYFIKNIIVETKKHTSSRPFRYALVGLAICVGVFIIPIIKRVASLEGTFEIGGSGKYRLIHMNIGYQQTMKHLFGTGIGTFPYQMAFDFPINQVGVTPDIPHNFVAQVGSETGIFSIVSMCFIIIIVLSANKIRSNNKFEIRKYTLPIASLLILMQFYPWYANSKTMTWFWILLSLRYTLRLSHET